MVTAENLTYRLKTDYSQQIQNDLTYAIAVSGPATLVAQAIKSNSDLLVRELRVTRRATRALSPGDDGAIRVDVAIDGARVEGRTTEDKPFDFDLEGPKPSDLAADPLRQ